MPEGTAVPGSTVRVRPRDGLEMFSAAGITVPAYVWDHTGTVDTVLPAGAAHGGGPLCTVRFHSGELWGEGDNHVTVVLAARFLEQVGTSPPLPDGGGAGGGPQPGAHVRLSGPHTSAASPAGGETEAGTGHHSSPVAGRMRRLEEALVDAGVLGREEIEAALDAVTAHRPPAGARVVARAWLDGGFRRRLLEDGNAGLAEMGLSTEEGGHEPVLRVVANEPDRHNLVVCTVCSCYPLSLLGPSPTWYASPAYRSRAVRDPQGVLAELRAGVDPGVPVDVWDATVDVRYLVLPSRPPGAEGRTEEELAGLVTRMGMVGAAPV